MNTILVQLGVELGLAGTNEICDNGLVNENVNGRSGDEKASKKVSFLLTRDVTISEVVLQPEEAVDAKWAFEETILQMIENGEFVYSVGLRFKEYKGFLR